ncbi:MAG: M48 family metallopeptidase, partial [Pseudoramibacter sp.]
NASHRWGSCSSKKSINFSWKLMMADGEAIDSVVVHELCHLRYLNHSKAFWQLVAQYCPDYQKQRKKLNQLSEKLMSENWEL